MPSTQIQWFPGHMAKTRRMIAECLPNVDIVINVLDSRIPISSENPEIGKLTASKPILNVFSKSSLADEKATALWKKHFEAQGKNCIFIDSITGSGINGIMPEIKNILKEKLERYESKGMNRQIKAMIVGIPNSGKSSLINRLSNSKKAKVEDRPGVTIDKQWVKTTIGLELMDMPGVLWPKFDDRHTGENLAITGAIKDEILDGEEIACCLIKRLRKLYPELLCERYKLSPEILSEENGDYDVLTEIGRKRGFLVSGGEINTERTASVLLDEFRSAKIGRITLEYPPEVK